MPRAITCDGQSLGEQDACGKPSSKRAKAKITSKQNDAVNTSYIWGRLHHEAKTQRSTPI